MKSWYRVSLGDGMTSGALADEIQSAFSESFQSAGRPAGMAVFIRPESEGRLHCEVIAYFSPAARTLAAAFDAESCARPLRAGLDLLAGDAQVWSALYPEA